MCPSGGHFLWLSYNARHRHDKFKELIENEIQNNKKVLFVQHHLTNCCTDLRNICAHYGRLYFRIFTAIPSNLPDLEKRAERRLFGALLALKTLYPDVNKWNNEIHEGLKKIMALYSAVIKLDHIGFPADWEVKLRKE